MFTIYTTQNCKYCELAKQLLESKQVPYEAYDMTNWGTARDALIARTGQKTVPQIFFGEQFLGGYTELDRLDRLGILDQMIKDGK